MRYLLVSLSLLIGSVTPAAAQVSVGVGIGLPSVEIGVNVPVYPELVVVPGYPVYYAPYADTNYFFYDGVYWVFQNDNWYASSWYNGPWRVVRPEHVPYYVLRVPVRYYRAPPPYFRAWHHDAPPRWGEHWGRGWERRHVGWDRWDHRGAPRPAPLPVYQREYSGDRYPHAPERQHAIRSEYYRYRPRETAAREHFQQPGFPGGRRAEPPPRVAPGPQQPQEHGRGPERREHREDRRDDRREDRREDRRDDRREDRREDRGDDHGRGRR
jgi:hypothetical protein